MPSPDRVQPRLRRVVACVVLFVATALLFVRAGSFGFVNYDDPAYVTDNPHVQGGLSWAGVVWAFTAHADYWHPLTWLSHMLDWQLYGAAPAGHHLTSVAWHALNAALVFLVFQRLAGGFWRSVFAAALFALHPLRVESVAWITERKDVMSGAFFLLTLLAYTRHVDRRATGRPAGRSYLLALGCFAAGLMSKPMLVSLPFLLLILDAWPFGRMRSAAELRQRLVEKIPFFALSGIVAVVTVLMQRQEGAFVLDLSFGARAGNALVSLVRYPAKFLWPVDLVVCYPHPGHWPVPVLAGAAALVIVAFGLAWVQRRPRPWILAGLAWYVITLLPVLGLVQVGFQAMADRYTYLPLLGLELAVLWSLPALTSRAAVVIAGTAASGLLVAYVMRTWQQLGVWRDSVSLFTHAANASAGNAVAEDFLSSALMAAGRFDDARTHAERAKALDPRNEKPLVTLAALAEREGRADDAAALYEAALRIRPANPAVRCQLGLIELGRGHLDEARTLMLAAVHRDPALRARTKEIARNILQQGNVRAAGVLFEVITVADPDDAETQFGLAICADALSRPHDAASALARAETAGRNDPEILSRVADQQARRRDLAAAVRLYRRVIELDPNRARAHAALGFLLIATGERGAGLAEWRRALEIDPSLPALRERLRELESRSDR